jgi:hypothetical protein
MVVDEIIGDEGASQNGSALRTAPAGGAANDSSDAETFDGDDATEHAADTSSAGYSSSAFNKPTATLRGGSGGAAKCSPTWSQRTPPVTVAGPTAMGASGAPLAGQQSLVLRQDASPTDSKRQTSSRALVVRSAAHGGPRPSPSEPQHVRVLFLQMDLLPMSLQQYLARRQPGSYCLPLGAAAGSAVALQERQRNLSIMLDVLNGLAFVHDRGLVHRDIKPANIFIDPSSLHACLGDFGLSKVAEDIGSDDEEGDAKDTAAAADCGDNAAAAIAAGGSSEPSPLVAPIAASSKAFEAATAAAHTVGAHTVGVGSPLYAAPEQVAGQRCDARCDAFAAGIMFVELYYDFSTASERIAVLRAAGEGRIDSAVLCALPELLIAAALCRQRPRDRLTAAEARRQVRIRYLEVTAALEDVTTQID